MTSEPTSAYVWIWRPDTTDPVVCGRLDKRDEVIAFVYARSYLDRANAVAIYEPELPLRAGYQYPASAQTRGVPLSVDAMPDSWGRRLNQPSSRRAPSRLRGHHLPVGIGIRPNRSSGLSGVGQRVRAPRGCPCDTRRACNHVRADRNWPAADADLSAALFRGTSIGGARPKALIDDGHRKLIAKFSSSTDTYPVVQGEFLAMELAHRVGLDVAPVELTKAAGRHALLVERFDRTPAGHRRRIVSALTILGLTTFPEGGSATYGDLTHQIRGRFAAPNDTLRELFGRITFNIMCGNTDDHGRNHAAFVGDELELTPAYDICPSPRSGETAEQAMAFDEHGTHDSRIELLVNAAELYLLDRGEAREIVKAQEATIREEWVDASEAAMLTKVNATDSGSVNS